MKFGLIILYEEESGEFTFGFLPLKAIVNQQQEVQFLPLGGTGVNGMLCDNLIKLFLSTAGGKLRHLLGVQDLVSVTKNTHISYKRD